jgi:gas vesicle protein
MKFGLVLSDPKLWSTLNAQLKDRADDVSDTVRDQYDAVREKYRDTYEDASDRLADATSVLRGDSRWIAPTLCFVGGVGVGVGLGILFAPASGEEMRDALRDKATDVTNDVKEKVSKMTNRYRASKTGPAFTGTDGD